MFEFLTERTKLRPDEVYYVQRCKFRKNIDDIKVKELRDILLLDNMRSFEFECGSIGGSLRRMTINKDFYKVFVFNKYRDENGNSLKVYAPIVFFKNICSIVDRLVEYGYGLQEYCDLCHHFQKEDESGFASYWHSKNDFWWDIDNDFFMFFEHTDKVLELMDALRKRKYGYERNIAKKSLARCYTKRLTAPNTSSFYDNGTSVKSSQYDKTLNTYYVEFIDDTPLETIFLEAIIIAKTSEGIVSFVINGIPFTINNNALQDNIVSENGIDLIDSETYSMQISELIAWYNEELQKREEATKLVTVLSRIRAKKENNE